MRVCVRVRDTYDLIWLSLYQVIMYCGPVTCVRQGACNDECKTHAANKTRQMHVAKRASEALVPTVPSTAPVIAEVK